MKRLALLAVLLSTPAYAHPPNYSQLSPEAQAWWNCMGQVRGDSGRGIICCDMNDAHYLNDDEWRIGDGGYQIRVGERWFNVPQKALVSAGSCGADPERETAMDAKVWYAPTSVENVVTDVTIYCFLPGTEY